MPCGWEPETPGTIGSSQPARTSRTAACNRPALMYLIAPMLAKPRIPFSHLLLFGWMPSPLRRLAYRWLLGYRVGRGVKFGLGSAVVGTDVTLGDHVEIGMLAIVMGRTISIGRHSSVGTMSYVSCRTIEMGEDARIREQVFVGGP